MKRINTTIALLMLCLSVSAEQETLINGENAIKETTKITFNGDNATITYRDGSTFTYDIAAVELNFTPPASKIEKDITTTKLDINKSSFFSMNQLVEDVLEVEGLKDSKNYRIFSANGKLELVGKTSGKTSHIDVKKLASGVYMFCIEGKNIKFIKK